MGDEKPDYQLYTDHGVFAASFIGGPLGGFLLIGINARRLGDTGAFAKNIFFGVASTVVLMAIAMALPPKFPGQAIPLAYSFGLRAYATQLFGNALEKHRTYGGEVASGWKAAGVGLLCLIPTIVIAVAIAFVMP